MPTRTQPGGRFVPQASRAVLHEDTAIVIRPRAAASALLLVVLAATIQPLLAAGEPQAQSASPLDRYGVWITASDPSLGPLETARRVLDQLGLRWYVGFDHDPVRHPPGRQQSNGAAHPLARAGGEHPRRRSEATGQLLADRTRAQRPRAVTRRPRPSTRRPSPITIA